MAGIGPELVHTREFGITTNSVAGEAALDFMFWPSANKVVKSADVGSVDLPFPGYTGDIKIKPLNGDYALGPSMIHIRMEPGAFIPAHLHKKPAEVLCILEGDFINENKAYGSGDFLHSKPGTVHGPHTTKKGCSFLALYSANTGEADPNDFFLAEAAKRG